MYNALRAVMLFVLFMILAIVSWIYPIQTIVFISFVIGIVIVGIEVLNDLEKRK